MTGKDKCKRLKSYRNGLAKANGIDFVAQECNFEGDCPGFCPACDEEIRYLENELRKKEENGEIIKFQGLIKLAFKNGDTVYDYTPNNSREMLGRIVDRKSKIENEDDELDFKKEIAKMIKGGLDDPNDDDDDAPSNNDESDVLMGDISSDYIDELFDDEDDDNDDGN